MAATLLLADDSVTIQRVIELTFANEDVRVVAVGDGQQAIARIDADRPDIVLADVGMPKADGYAVATHVKRSPALQHIPVLLLTGAFEPIDEARARATGCDGVLVKPFEPQQLVARVRDLLAGRRPASLWPEDLPRIDTPAARPAPSAPADTQHRVVPPPPAWVPPAQEQAPVALPTPPPPPPARPAATPDQSPLPSALDAAFDSGLDDLDFAFSRLDPSAAPTQIGHAAADFKKDLDRLRIEPDEAPAAAPSWDIAQRPSQPPALTWDVVEAPTAPLPQALPPVELPQFHAPPPVAPPVRVAQAPTPETTAAPSVSPRTPKAEPPPPTVAPEAPAAQPDGQAKVSIATAFSALLAAEQTYPGYRAPAAPPASLSEAAMEDVVRRVLTRMTDEVVRKVVLDAAERLIRAEIERIKTPTDGS